MSGKPASPATEDVIRVEHLIARFGTKTILDDVTCNVRRGEVFVVVGGSGCGKTTLLRHIIGLLKPTAGRVFVGDEDITRLDEDGLRRVQRRLGVTFQNGALFGSLTLGENIALPLQEHSDLPADTIDLLVRMKLDMVSLGGFQDFMISELSGGMKKRAALARAMALDPSILFFDEPSAGLDPITSAELDALILQINKSLGTTMVVISHELPSVFTIADRVIMLDTESKGIIADGDPRELRDHSKDPIVHAFFNREPATGQESATGKGENEPHGL